MYIYSCFNSKDSYHIREFFVDSGGGGDSFLTRGTTFVDSGGDSFLTRGITFVEQKASGRILIDQRLRRQLSGGIGFGGDRFLRDMPQRIPPDYF